MSGEAVCPAVLCRGARPVEEDVAGAVLEAEFPLSARVKRSDPVGFA